MAMGAAKIMTQASDEPEARIEHLVKLSNLNSGDVDHHIPPVRYYYYGLELLKLANGHYNEGHLEKAYILYISFIKLFTKEIYKHPHCHTVPPEVKALNAKRLTDVLVKEKVLKERLLSIYQEEYDNCHKSNWNEVESPPSSQNNASTVPPMPVHEFIVLRRMGMFQNCNDFQ